jgi:hypothetical protein
MPFMCCEARLSQACFFRGKNLSIMTSLKNLDFLDLLSTVSILPYPQGRNNHIVCVPDPLGSVYLQDF